MLDCCFLPIPLTPPPARRCSGNEGCFLVATKALPRVEPPCSLPEPKCRTKCRANPSCCYDPENNKMLVSQADSKTIEWFCVGLGLDSVLANPTFIPFKWQRARLNPCIVFYWDIFFETNVAHCSPPPVRKSGKGPVRPPRVSAGATGA